MDPKRFNKFVLALNCAVPAGVLAWDVYQGQAGANPVNYAIKTTGLLSLIFLVLSLVITPLRKTSGWNGLVVYRRTLGLYAFYYAAAHFGIYFWFDQAHVITATAREIWSRWYLMVGLTGLLAMVPLAVTSTNGMIRRLGPKRWGALHELAYVAVIAGCVHYYMQAKSDKRQPLVFAGVAAALLAYRYFAQFSGRAVKPTSRAAPAPVPSLPAMPAMPMPDRALTVVKGKPKFWRGELRVVKTFDETQDVRTFRLAAADGSGRPFDFLPGQYLNLALPINGGRVNRSYTIASSPTRVGYCELTVKREEGGVASSHLHEMIKQGDVVPASAPAGKFVFTGEEAAGIVLIAGGVGITPMMSVIRYLTDLSWRGDIDLIFAARTQADIIFADEIELLRKRHSNFQPTITLSRVDSDSWRGPRGRITADLIRRAVPHIADRLVHICGPSPMMEPIMAMLRELGVPKDRIRTESFERAATSDVEAIPDATITTPPQATAASAAIGGALEATFARSAKSSKILADETLLDAAERNGIAIESDCRAGICGTCKTRLVSGNVDMDVRDALSAADVSAGLILACQARAVSNVTIDA